MVQAKKAKKDGGENNNKQIKSQREKCELNDFVKQCKK
jgi:hypothetical protein